jgi:Peptidase A4 family
MHPPSHLSLALIAAAAVAASAPAAPATAGVSSAPRPHISQVSATRTTLAAAGGETRISAVVGDATTCAWSGKWAGTVTGTNNEPYACGAGASAVETVTDTLALPPNPSSSSRVWVVYLIARGPGGSSPWSHIDIAQMGLSPLTPTSTSPATVSTTPAPAGSSPLTSPAWTSSNWSGYVLPSSSLLAEVGGQWTVPTLNCSATPSSGASVWVGIGGETWPTGGTSGTLLQTGVTVDCDDGVQENRGWFEELPSSPDTSEIFTGFPISAGDAIRASVYRDTSGGWETRVDDLTAGTSGVMVTGEGWGVASDAGSGSLSFPQQGSTATLSYSGGYTAEWIVEDYARGTSVSSATNVPLADFGTVAFTNLTTSLASWALSPSESLGIFQDGGMVSQPSAPARNGFSVTYSG